MDKSILNYIKIGLAIGVIGVLLIYTYDRLSIISKKEKDKYYLEISEKNTTWYFKIYQNKELLIKQDYIPVVQGNQPFNSKEDAKKIGELMITKLKNNKLPTITYSDLKSNDIKFNTLVFN